MKKLLWALAPIAFLGLAGCETYGDGYAANDVYYDGYYDNFYGPVSAGYWGPDEYFYYRTGTGGTYIRDNDRHFRRDTWANARQFHMRDRHDHH